MDTFGKSCSWNPAQSTKAKLMSELTRSPDASFTELRTPYEGDDRLRLPATVFNSVPNCPEMI